MSEPITDDDIVSCEVCHSLIWPLDFDTHTEWHYKLNVAIANAGRWPHGMVESPGV